MAGGLPSGCLARGKAAALRPRVEQRQCPPTGTHPGAPGRGRFERRGAINRGAGRVGVRRGLPSCRGDRIATEQEVLRETNIDGTANLYEALKSQHRLQAFIFTSTVVTGDAEGALLTEETPLPVETEYGRTKQAGEELLLEAFHSHHFPVRIVRPCHIYGDGGWFGEVTQQLRRGKLRMPGDGKNLWDVVHVDDVAAAPASVLKHGQNGEIYHVADDTPVAMGEFVAEAARVLGVDPPGSAPIFLPISCKDTILSVTRSARTSNKKLKALGWNRPTRITAPACTRRCALRSDAWPLSSAVGSTGDLGMQTGIENCRDCVYHLEEWEAPPGLPVWSRAGRGMPREASALAGALGIFPRRGVGWIRLHPGRVRTPRIESKGTSSHSIPQQRPSRLPSGDWLAATKRLLPARASGAIE